MSHYWRLDDGRQTLVLATKDKLLPQVVYWGKPLPKSDPSTNLAEAHQKDYTCLLYTSDAADDLHACRSRWSPYH